MKSGHKSLFQRAAGYAPGLFNALFFEVSLKCHRSQNKRAGGKIWDSNLGKCVNL